MFDFFRKYQRSFFLVITVVIVLSFSFFGSFGVMSDGSFREQIAFKAVDGTTVTRHELDEMVVFLATDADDKRIFGGAWGPNFLNDGVIKKDFLETGLAFMLVEAYPNEVKADLMTRAEKERHYLLYSHPQARFVGVEAIWNQFAPGMVNQFNALRAIQDPISRESLQARVMLFLMEKQMSAPLVRQMLRYQEKQYSTLKPDPYLDRLDLSLFGYHTTEDWFGSHFTHLVGEFVINAAVVAQERGYYVSKADAFADLMKNAETSFQQNANSPHRGVANVTEYFNEQLHRLGMDRNMAINVWQQVLLFRRLFQDMGASVFVDPLTFGKYDTYASEVAEGELYRLPKEFHFNSFRAVQKFETYLGMISNRSDAEKAQLAMPTTFFPVAEVQKKNPECVQKRYLLDIASVDKKSLAAKVSLKESWIWEVDTAHWELIKKQFPELAVKEAKNPEERDALLDALDDQTRLRVDTFARNAMINDHPEWIEQALDEAKSMRQMVGLCENGSTAAILGLKNGKILMGHLDAAPLGQLSEALKHFSADNNTYYRIVVIERTGAPEVLSFVEADHQGILDKELDRQLEAYYAKTRESNPEAFQRNDKSWKPFVDVKDLVAERYFDQLLQQIRTYHGQREGNKKIEGELINDYAATMRLLPYMDQAKKSLEQGSDAFIVKKDENMPLADHLHVAQTLADQWKLEKVAYRTSRSSSDQAVDKEEIFSLSEGEWTQVNTPANGNVNFFHLTQKQSGKESELRLESVDRVRKLLSNDAQQRLMAQLLTLIADREAISLDYLQKVPSVQVVEME